MTKSARRAEDALRKAQKVRYLQLKEALLEKEKNNRTMVVALRTDQKKWWKIFGNSVVFYEKLVAERIGRDVHVWQDTDYGAKSEQGVISIADVESFNKRMEAAGYRLIPERCNENFKAWALGRKVPEDVYNSWMDADKKKREVAEKIIMPAVNWPRLKMLILELRRRSASHIMRMSHYNQVVYGQAMNESIFTMARALYAAARTPSDPVEELVRVAEALLDFQALLMLVMDAGLINSDGSIHIGECLIQLQEAVDLQIKREVKKAEGKSQARKRALKLAKKLEEAEKSANASASEGESAAKGKKAENASTSA